MGEKGKSIFGLQEEYVGAISYLGFVVTGILVYVFERDNKTVRFHALQSTILFAALGILSFAISLLAEFGGMIPLIGWVFVMCGGLLTGLISLASIIACLYLAYNAYRGIQFKVPVIGQIVWDQVNKG